MKTLDDILNIDALETVIYELSPWSSDRDLKLAIIALSQAATRLRIWRSTERAARIQKLTETMERDAK